MIKLYITKANASGNNYYILCDENKKQFEKSYNISPFSLYDIKIKVTSKKQLQALAYELLKAGYNQIER